MPSREGKAMNEPSTSSNFYTARQAAKKLGVSEARIRKLANLYGWEYRMVGSDKLFSAADIHKYIESRNYINRLLGGH
jgi:excisionase family DNA binding protein